MHLVIDHLGGKRRGRRERHSLAAPLSVGRHPGSTVRFDAVADIAASTHHAEIAIDGEAVVVRDLGSSNGTFVGGRRVANHRIEEATATVITFGDSGPQLSLWWTSEEGREPAVPEEIRLYRRHRWVRRGTVGVGVVVALIWAVRWLAQHL